MYSCFRQLINSIQIDKKLQRTTLAVFPYFLLSQLTVHYGLVLKFTPGNQPKQYMTHRCTLIWKQALLIHCKLTNVMRFLVLVLMIWCYHSTLQRFIDRAHKHLVLSASLHLKSTENHQALQIMSISLNQVGWLISFPLPHNAVFDFSCCV